MTGFDTSVRIAPGTRVDVFETTALTFTPNVRAYLMSGRFQPYFVAGGGLMWAQLEQTFAGSAEDSFTGFVFRAGGGIETYLSENTAFDVGIVYNLPTGDLDGLDFLGISFDFVYRF